MPSWSSEYNKTTPRILSLILVSLVHDLAINLALARTNWFARDVLQMLLKPLYARIAKLAKSYLDELGWLALSHLVVEHGFELEDFDEYTIE